MVLLHRMCKFSLSVHKSQILQAFNDLDEWQIKIKASLREEGEISWSPIGASFYRDVGLFSLLECRCKLGEVTTLAEGGGWAVVRANLASVVKKLSLGRRVGSLGEEQGKKRGASNVASYVAKGKTTWLSCPGGSSTCAYDVERRHPGENLSDYVSNFPP